MKAKTKQKKKKAPVMKRFWIWLSSHKLSTGALGAILGTMGLGYTYINTGSDSLRTDIYQPLYTEINVMDGAVRSNNRYNNYSSASYEAIRKSGNLLRIPRSLREKISRLYQLSSEEHSHILPVTMRIAWMMPQEIRAIRTQADDKAWAEKTVIQLNSQARTPVEVYGLSFNMSHTARSPSIRTVDPQHPRIDAPGIVDWEINDWMRFPQSATDINNSWTNTWFLSFDARSESWEYRITHEDLDKTQKSLEGFLRPTYERLSDDQEFQQLLKSYKEALDLMNEVKLIIADRVSQPKHLMDLIDR
jgi:hypothetical protein